MLLADVNVLLGAHRKDDPAHGLLNSWLEERLDGSEPFGVSELVLSAVVRVATNHGAFPHPATPQVVLTFCEQVRSSPASRIIAPGPRHWDIFAELVRTTRARANVVPDAYLAALAIENRARFVTRDRGFARFPGLRILDPLAE